MNSIDIQDFALQLLNSTSLEEKLFFPEAGIEAFVDQKKQQGIKLPKEPGRPDQLRFRDTKGTKSSFPGINELEKETARGIVLHYFANHELLAMELMALALLKFHDAPEKFRLGICQTIAEEQRHMRFYQSRMQDFGVAFGAVPVNRFFWDCIEGMKTPLDYVTRMSLTFEQANLDFSLYYKTIFGELGDEKTADILETVYREEIGHVKYGVTWFNRWRDQNKSEWDAFQSLLPFPMTPSRAKGIGFDHSGREMAGFSKEFVDELFLFRHSKGRPPIVYFFNPGAESEALLADYSYTEPAPIQAIKKDFSSLMMFVANSDDVVIVNERPSGEFLRQFAENGQPLPQFAEWSDLKDRLVAKLEPWARTKYAQKMCEQCSGRILEEMDLTPTALFSKAFANEQLLNLPKNSFPSAILKSTAEVENAYKKHLQECDKPLVLKAPFGTSGRGMIRLMNGAIEDNQKHWITATLKNQGCLIGEPWVTKVADLSVQIVTSPDHVKILGITHFLTDKRGQYLAHFLGKKFFNLPQEFHQFFHENNMQADLEDTANLMGAELIKAGYYGPAGIDAFIYEEDGTMKLRPLVEINPRYTMGRFALEIEKLIVHKAEALWLHFSKKFVTDLGFQDFASFAQSLTERYPPRFTTRTRRDQKEQRSFLEEGSLCTNDPAIAKSILSVLFVGKASEDALKNYAAAMI